MYTENGTFLSFQSQESLNVFYKTSWRKMQHMLVTGIPPTPRLDNLVGRQTARAVKVFFLSKPLYVIIHKDLLETGASSRSTLLIYIYRVLMSRPLLNYTTVKEKNRGNHIWQNGRRTPKSWNGNSSKQWYFHQSYSNHWLFSVQKKSLTSPRNLAMSLDRWFYAMINYLCCVFMTILFVFGKSSVQSIFCTAVDFKKATRFQVTRYLLDHEAHSMYQTCHNRQFEKASYFLNFQANVGFGAENSDGRSVDFSLRIESLIKLKKVVQDAIYILLFIGKRKIISKAHF